MYEEQGNALCPVMSLEKYLKKILPDSKDLYLQSATDNFWYTSTGSKPAVTDVTKDVQGGRDTQVLHQIQPESEVSGRQHILAFNST